MWGSPFSILNGDVGIYVTWLSPSQLKYYSTMGTKKQAKKRLIRERSEEGDVVHARGARDEDVEG